MGCIVFFQNIKSNKQNIKCLLENNVKTYKNYKLTNQNNGINNKLICANVKIKFWIRNKRATVTLALNGWNHTVTSFFVSGRCSSLCQVWYLLKRFGGDYSDTSFLAAQEYYLKVIRNGIIFKPHVKWIKPWPLQLK